MTSAMADLLVEALVAGAVADHDRAAVRAQDGASSWILKAARSAPSEAATADAAVLFPWPFPFPFPLPLAWLFFTGSMTGRPTFAEAAGVTARPDAGLEPSATAVAVAVDVAFGGSWASSMAEGPSSGCGARAAAPNEKGEATTDPPRSWIPSAARSSPTRKRLPSQRKM